MLLTNNKTLLLLIAIAFNKFVDSETISDGKTSESDTKSKKICDQYLNDKPL